jgi:hypothetical protein
MCNIFNITPHAIIIEGHGEIAPSGTIARVSTERAPQPDIAGIRIISQKFGGVSGLPAPMPGTIFIVSSMVLSALNGARPDVFAPDTGADAVRDSDGKIVAVRGLVA